MKHIGNLKVADGAKHGKKRIGRGYASGYGGTSTKGHKGQKSRSGATINPSFEGGQMPINRRVPKFGFFNRFKKEYQVVNIAKLQELHESNKLGEGKVNFETLLSLGILNKKSIPLKILGDGELSASLEVTAHKFTKSAKEKIESAGGTVIING